MEHSTVEENSKVGTGDAEQAMNHTQGRTNAFKRSSGERNMAFPGSSAAQPPNGDSTIDHRMPNRIGAVFSRLQIRKDFRHFRVS